MRKFDITRAQSFVVIIRATTMRGKPQQDALAELEARGLWLNEAQKKEAGLTK